MCDFLSVCLGSRISLSAQGPHCFHDAWFPATCPDPPPPSLLISSYLSAVTMRDTELGSYWYKYRAQLQRPKEVFKLEGPYS